MEENKEYQSVMTGIFDVSVLCAVARRVVRRALRGCRVYISFWLK